MLKLTGRSAIWPEVHHSSDKGMCPACISPGQHLVEWTWHIVDLSYFVDAEPVHSSSSRLELTSQFVPLKVSVVKMIKPGDKFLNCNKLIIYWLDITFPGKAQKH